MNHNPPRIKAVFAHSTSWLIALLSFQKVIKIEYRELKCSVKNLLSPCYEKARSRFCMETFLSLPNSDLRGADVSSRESRRSQHWIRKSISYALIILGLPLNLQTSIKMVSPELNVALSICSRFATRKPGGSTLPRRFCLFETGHEGSRCVLPALQKISTSRTQKVIVSF